MVAFRLAMTASQAAPAANRTTVTAAGLVTRATTTRAAA